MQDERPGDILKTDNKNADRCALEEAVANLQPTALSENVDETMPSDTTEEDAHYEQSGSPKSSVLLQQSSPRGHMMPALFGFIAGAVFWHLVGFWSLVSDLVFNGPRDRTVVVSRSAEMTSGEIIHLSGQPASRLTSENSKHNVLRQANCTTLAQDKPGGPMRKVPCDLATQAARKSIATSFTPSDFEASMDLSQTTKTYNLEGQGWSSLTTGSLHKPNKPPQPSRQKTGGWTASLEAAPTPNQ